jgi:hypothetical protein
MKGPGAPLFHALQAELPLFATPSWDLRTSTVNLAEQVGHKLRVTNPLRPRSLLGATRADHLRIWQWILHRASSNSQLEERSAIDLRKKWFLDPHSVRFIHNRVAERGDQTVFGSSAGQPSICNARPNNISA